MTSGKNATNLADGAENKPEKGQMKIRNRRPQEQPRWHPLQRQKQLYGEAVSGNWQSSEIYDDWIGGAAAVGALGWVTNTANSGAIAMLTGAQNRSALMAGGFSLAAVSSTAVITNGLSASPFIYPASLNTNFLLMLFSYEMEWRIAFDTVLPTATNQFRTMLGVFDNAAASTAGNFIGVEVTGTAGVGQNFRAAYGTAAAPTYVDTGIGIPALDTPVNVRMVLTAEIINGVGLFGYMKVFVNNVPMNPNNLPLLDSAQPFGPTYPAIIAGFPAIKAIGVAGTSTGLVFVDSFSCIIQGRTQN